MNGKTFRYSSIIFIFLIILSINMVQAADIDQNSAGPSYKVELKDVSISEAIHDEKLDSKEINANERNDADLSNPIESSQASEDSSSMNQTSNTDDDFISSSNESMETNGTSAVSDNTNDSFKTSEKIELKKAYLSTSTYVIKSNYLKVYLKDITKKGISKGNIILNINGKRLKSKTDSKGLAKFKINEAGKTYNVKLIFDGNSAYKATAKSFKLRVIGKPVYTKIILAETGIIANESLKVYLKTKDGKAITKQSVLITIDGKTYNKTTNKNGIIKLRINKKPKIYSITVKYIGKGNYVPATKKARINVLKSKVIGKTSYGKVYFIGVIGNRSSKKRIAYVVGLHPLEHQVHDSVYNVMKNKVDMRYKYYIYRIVISKKSGDYSIDRMRGQKLAKRYIVPHAKKQKYNCVIDIHSTTGVSYAKTYFIHVPKNKHVPSMKLAKKTIKTIKSIEKNSKMQYWSPQSQTSPPYIHLPLIKAGTPTFVFETWTYEKKSQTDKRAKILTTAVDKIFG